MISYAGSIGSFMSGSGLAESLETSHGKNTIKHLLTGKVIVRALRGQLLVEAVLEETLMRQFLMRNKNLSNTEVEGNSKSQTNRNNENIIYDQIEREEDAICGEQYDESTLENEDSLWAEEILDKKNNAEINEIRRRLMKLCHYMMN